MKRLIFTLALVMAVTFSCKNEKPDYPDNIDGKWMSPDDPNDWIEISGMEGIVNIASDESYFYSGWVYYVQSRGYGVIPNEDESSDISILEIQVENPDPNTTWLRVTGMDKDLHELFEIYMTHADKETEN